MKDFTPTIIEPLFFISFPHFFLPCGMAEGQRVKTKDRFIYPCFQLTFSLLNFSSHLKTSIPMVKGFPHLDLVEYISMFCCQEHEINSKYRWIKD